MGSTVIVALPTLNDKVNRISSEKIPHMTLLFLDELVGEELTKVLEHVAHATSHLSPFGTTVDYRGTLGDDKADVLFMEDNGWDLKRVREFRHHLLMDNTIRKAYDSVEQYPQWTPHVTLGYPQTPAREDTSEYPGVSYVQFDRIAVWNEQDSGPEFRLEYEDHPMEVRMSDMTTEELGEALAEDILMHYGVKGMRWGVRKGDYEGASRATNKEAKKDANEFARAKMFYGEGAGTRRKLIKAKIETKSKKDPTYKEAFNHHLQAQDLAKHASKARSERRRKDATATTTKTARGVHRELNGGIGNVSMTSKVLATAYKVAKASTAHADDTDSMTTSELGEALAEDILAHAGVKGMKWGVRKDEGHQGERVKTKQLAKLDKKWEKENTGINGWVKANNAMADRMNGGLIDKFNADPRWKDVDLSKDSKLEKTYMDEYVRLSDKIFREETVKLGMNPSGTKAFEIRADEDGNEYAYLTPIKPDVKHAEGDVQTVFKMLRDAKGFVTGLEEVELELKHAGVKGMKWGVRKAEERQRRADSLQKRATVMTERAERRSSKLGSGAEMRKGNKLQKQADREQRIANKKFDKLDKKFEKQSQSFKTTLDLHHRGATLYNKNDLDRINNKPEYKNADFTRDTPLRQKYYKEHQDAFIDNLAKAAREFGTNASGTKEYGIFETPSGGWDVMVQDVKHASGSYEGMHVDVVYKDGHIVSVSIPEQEVAHYDSETFLAHYGVKGMKWGVTKVDRAAQVTRTQDSPPKRGSNDVTVSQRRAGTYSKAKGGERNVATDEAVKAVAGRQKAKKSTTDALTNDELRATIERMQLEQQFVSLSKKSDRRTLGRKLVEHLLTPQPVPQQGKKKKVA